MSHIITHDIVLFGADIIIINEKKQELSIDRYGVCEGVVCTCICDSCGEEYERVKAYVPELKEWKWVMKYIHSEKYFVDNWAVIPERCCNSFCREASIKKAERVAHNTANSTRRRKERRDAARALRPDPICQYCQQPFKAHRSDAKYCSDNCRQNGHRSKQEESKPYLLECFRLPEDERQESPLGYYRSSFYTNGIGFDLLIEKLEGIPGIKDKVNIVKCTKYERLDRQELYFNDSTYSDVKNDPLTRYPFLILSNDSILTSMPMAPGDNQLEYLLTQIILEKIDKS